MKKQSNPQPTFLKPQPPPKPPSSSGSTVVHGYNAALAELRKLLVDAKTNRLEDDPRGIDKGWSGYIQGIESAIYRLEMHGAL